MISLRRFGYRTYFNRQRRNTAIVRAVEEHGFVSVYDRLSHVCALQNSSPAGKIMEEDLALLREIYMPDGQKEEQPVQDDVVVLEDLPVQDDVVVLEDLPVQDDVVVIDDLPVQDLSPVAPLIDNPIRKEIDILRQMIDKTNNQLIKILDMIAK